MSTEVMEKMKGDAAAIEELPILLVDDDERLLAGLVRRHRRSFKIVTACGGEQGLEALRQDGPFSVVISDFRMPGMDGIEFLRRAQQADPDAVRMMLTGNAELSVAIDSVNHGHVFRFMGKPVGDEAFQAAVRSGQEQYELIRAERVLLEQTLQGSIQLLLDVLALANPMLFSRAHRLRSLVGQAARSVGLANAWQVETAALLSQLGSISMPLEVLDRAASGAALDEGEQEMIERQPGVTSDLLARIPRLDGVAEIVRLQTASAPDLDRAGLDPDRRRGVELLQAALCYDRTLSQTEEPKAALKAVRKLDLVTPEVVDALRDVHLEEGDEQIRTVATNRLLPGMVLEEAVVSDSGAVLLPKGFTMTFTAIERLRNHAQIGAVAPQVRVRMSAGSAQAEPPEA